MLSVNSMRKDRTFDWWEVEWKEVGMRKREKSS